MTNNIWRYLSIILPILLFGVLASLFLERPGLQTDEILFANLSLGEINHTTYISRKIGGITFFVISYIGALKSWIFIPIFKVFGFNYFSVRIPMIILSMCSLLLVYKSINISFKKPSFAWFILMALVTESTFITMVRTDVGPIAIEYFCKILSILLIFKYLQSKKQANLYFLPIVLALGIFNKINFIWFSNALLFSGLILIFLLETKKEKLTLVKFLGLTFLLEFILFIGFNKLNPGMVSSSNIGIDLEFIKTKIELFYYFGKGIFDGTGFYRIQYLISEETFGYNSLSKGIYQTFFYLFEVCLAVFFVHILVVIRKIQKKQSDNGDIYFLFFVCIIVCISAQIFVVENARNLWHFYTLFPFFTICVFYSVYKLLGIKFSWLFFFIVIIYNLNNFSTFVYALTNKTPNPFWSNKINEVAKYVEPIKGEFVELDWGLSTQLLCITKQDKFKRGFLTKTGELTANKSNAEDVLYSDYIENKDLSQLYFISFQSKLADPKMNIIFDKMLAKKGFQKILIKNFYEIDNTLIYSIFRLKKG
ncbi:MAG: glycosyltransferase family 39 protein [Leadbetterella sp.]|nr:glycosyltransferase family 39 protein [Leadbetterella sp.]